MEEPEILRYWEISRLTYNILGDIFCLLMLSKAKSILFDEKCVLKRGKVRKEVLVCQASGGYWYWYWYVDIGIGGGEILLLGIGIG